METIDSTNLRKNLSASLDKVNEDHIPLLITRRNGAGAVLLSEADFAAYEEMRHLTSSINNVNAINQGIKDIEEGRGIEMTLEEFESYMSEDDDRE